MINLPILPKPVSCQTKPGEFHLTQQVAISFSKETEKIAHYLHTSLSADAGLKLAIKEGQSASGGLNLVLDPKLANLGIEGYRLSISPTQVNLSAAAPAGLFYAVQTLRQLVSAASLPCVEIEDFPRFAWRGTHLDVGRHFMPIEFIYKFIDLLAMHKLNVFHWHLTEDQGWRIEIKKYPRLTEIGAWRKETMRGNFESNQENLAFDGTPHGGFYTQDQMRQVVAYAQERFVTVVPEIEMPGHAEAAIAAYPELGNTGKPIDVSNHWGVHQHVFNAEDSTIRFLQDVLDEVLDVFPSQFIHIGGDECPKVEWKASPAAQAKMNALGLKDEEELQSWFVRQMDDYLTARGRRLVGWDEILEGGLAPGAVVMSWRGEEGGINAANAGHDVVMAPYQYVYYDYYQSEDKEGEPLAIGGLTTLKHTYSYEPIPAQIDKAMASHVLGAQAQLWTEYMPNPQQVEYMAFPRLCAFSEVVWSPKEARSYPDFTTSLPVHLERLERMKVNYRKQKF
jgi:hexosaminidase